MIRESLKTLFFPFESGALASPAGGRVLFLGAEPGFALPKEFGAALSLVQGFRPFFNALVAGGFDVSPRPEGDGFDAALVLCGRHRGHNERMLAEALSRTREGALILLGGGKNDGMSSLRARIGALLPIAGSLSKHHGIVFWLRCPETADGTIEALMRDNGPALIDGRFKALPGMFSHDRIDRGSQLLAASLPDKPGRQVADFCAGWGYLSARLAERCPTVTSIHLYEADFESLEAAKGNMVQCTAGDVRFFWHDLLNEPVMETYDAVVMNPPFHIGRAAEPDIGRRLIAVAAGALRPGGRLFLVANRRLPYEEVLQNHFTRIDRLADESGFKVFSASR